MKYVYYIFVTDTMHTPSTTDEHVSTVMMTPYEIARHVRKLNDMNDRYYYFMRGQFCDREE